MKSDVSILFQKTRKAFGKSQEEFAKMLGCSRVSLSMYETGKTEPGAKKYDRLLKLRDLLTGKEADQNQYLTGLQC